MKNAFDKMSRSRAAGVFRAAAFGAWLAMVLCLCGGCLHLDQAIILHKDGSGRMLFHYSVPEDTVTTLAAGQRIIEQWQGRNPGPEATDLQWFFSKPAVTRQFTSRGTSLKEYRVYNKGGRRHVQIEVAAANAWTALESGRFGDFQVTRTPEGDVVIRADLPEDPSAEPPGPKELERLRALCEGLSMTLTIEAPTEVLDATAPGGGGGRKATWVFDPAVDESFLSRMPVIELKLSGKGLDWHRKK